MDLAHLGLARRPFRPTPDTAAFQPTATHDAAVGGLRAAFANGDAIALVDGEPGVGKTLAVLKFLEGLPADVPRVLIPAPRFARPAELFQAILFDFGAEYRGLTETELRLGVTERLLGRSLTAGPTVLVLDEAQHLSDDLLEEVRLLGNLETRSARAALVVLVAQPSLRERLGRPELAAVAQRIGARARVEPLTREESARFVWRQLEGGDRRPADLIDEEPLNLFTAHCHGRPRLLNQAAALAFTLAAEAGAEGVDVEAAVEALTRLGLLTELPADELEVEPLVKPVRAKLPRRRSA
jgi:type II secretory pathway predicted ATPase ExeA